MGDKKFLGCWGIDPSIPLKEQAEQIAKEMEERAERIKEEEEWEIAFWQKLIDSGEVWKMEASYGRTAMGMIAEGYCTLGPNSAVDTEGHYIPSKAQIPEGEPGSESYVATRY